MSHLQEVDKTDGGNLGEGHELPVQDEGTTRAGGEALGKHRSHLRAAKVEGWGAGAPCTYCGEDLDYSAGDSRGGHAPESDTRARSMSDRAERQAIDNAERQPCVVCRSA